MQGYIRFWETKDGCMVELACKDSGEKICDVVVKQKFELDRDVPCEIHLNHAGEKRWGRRKICREIWYNVPTTCHREKAKVIATAHAIMQHKGERRIVPGDLPEHFREVDGKKQQLVFVWEYRV